jgi:hypothetical protein
VHWSKQSFLKEQGQEQGREMQMSLGQSQGLQGTALPITTGSTSALHKGTMGLWFGWHTL